MGKASLLILKLLIILTLVGWISLWLLKPTELWTKKWKKAEESAGTTVIGYNGLDFAVYTFPIIALAMMEIICLELQKREIRCRHRRISTTTLSSPLIVNSYLGILSTAEFLLVLLFIVFLAWTFGARISYDFKKMMPVKSFSLKAWQFKIFRLATRCGLLAEACLALLLLPILRGMTIFRVLGIQFEASVRYHIWLGTAMIFFATLHGAGTFFIWGIKDRIQDEMWEWQKTGRIYLAGEISLVTGLVIWITSLPQIRRKQFEIFYYTHHLYTVFLVFFLFHAGDRHFYMVFPGIFLYAIDKVLRIIQSRPESCIVHARVFPCKAIEMTLPKDPRLKYAPTSVIFIKIPSISKFQWHSFSITSSSSVDDHTMSIIIKSEGWWTSSLYDILQAEIATDVDQRQCIPIAVEGPYGPAFLDFSRYDSLLLIAGGIGITPFLSILQEIDSGSGQRSSWKRFPNKMQLIYAVKNSQDICLLTPILPLLLDQKVEESQLKVKVFVTQEERSDATIREVFNELSQVKTVKFDRKRSSYAIYGLESPNWMAGILGFSSVTFFVVLCFFNYVFPPPAEKSSKHKTKKPSSSTDLLLLCSLAIAIIGSAVATLIRKWKRPRKKFPTISDKQDKALPSSLLEFEQGIEKHEIHFGGRPDFQDIFAKFANETGGSNVGVLVCGSESMKESVASMCQLSSQGFQLGTQKGKPYFRFHSLNFTL